MRDYRNEIHPKKDATYEDFQFDIYKINVRQEFPVSC